MQGKRTTQDGGGRKNHLHICIITEHSTTARWNKRVSADAIVYNLFISIQLKVANEHRLQRSKLKTWEMLSNEQSKETLSLHMQFVRGYRGPKNLKTAGGKTVNESNNLCRISITSQKQNSSYRSLIFRCSSFYKTLSLSRRSDFEIH